MEYLAVKHLHVGFAALSGIFFFVRGLWMLFESQLLQRGWARVLPHAIDSCLLLAAIVLVVASAQYPGQQAWLTAKVVALLAYIGLGTVALRRGRMLAWLAALASFLYIAGVALTRSPFIFG